MDVAAINPATGRTVKVYQETSPAEVTAAIERAHETWKRWSGIPFAERAKPMKKVAAMLRARKEALAKLMATEMGKPLGQGAAEAEKCAWACDYYADNAERFLQPETVKTEATRSYVAFEPLGIVLAVMPWNFSALAGLSFRGAGTHGGKRGPAQACVQRARLRAGDRGDVR